jgi:hypothetical protein
MSRLIPSSDSVQRPTGVHAEVALKDVLAEVVSLLRHMLLKQKLRC